MEDSLGSLFVGIWLMIVIGIMVFALAVEIFIGWCFKRIAEKTDTMTYANLWWIPMVNLLIPISVAGKPTWWLVLALFVPIANIVVRIVIWVEVAKKLNKSEGWGVVAAVFSIVGAPYLAFSD